MPHLNGMFFCGCNIVTNTIDLKNLCPANYCGQQQKEDE